MDVLDPSDEIPICLDSASQINADNFQQVKKRNEYQVRQFSAVNFDYLRKNVGVVFEVKGCYMFYVCMHMFRSVLNYQFYVHDIKTDSRA